MPKYPKCGSEMFKSKFARGPLANLLANYGGIFLLREGVLYKF